MVPATAITQKIARQSATNITIDPANGASIGDTEITSMTIAISRVASVPVDQSRMIARGMTITAAAPRPCIARAAVRFVMSGANAAQTDARR